MRRTRWAFALILSISLLSPPVSMAQGRGQDGGGKERVEKVEKRSAKDQKKRAKAGKADRKNEKAARLERQEKQNLRAARAKAAKLERQQKRHVREAKATAARLERQNRRETRVERAQDRDRLLDRLRAARAERQRVREVRQERAQSREGRPLRVTRSARVAPVDQDRERERRQRQLRREGRRDEPVVVRLVERLRRDDARARARARERRAEVREMRRAPVRDLRVRDDRMRFRGLDTNGDGRIARREWRGNAVSFRNHDWNGDGILAGAEVAPAGRKQRITRRDVRWDWGRLARVRDADRTRRVLRDRPILRARSGELGRRYVVAPRPLVTRLDRALVVNQRLWVDRPGPLRIPAPVRDDVVVVDFGLDLDDPLGLFALPLSVMLTEALIDDVDLVMRTERWADYDLDYDGYVTPLEWPAGRRSFQRFDRDDDLILVRDELFVDDDLVVVDRDRFLLFEALDRDEDGLVAPWEWPGSVESFFYRDFNGDGAVSMDEFLGLDVDVGTREVGFDTLDFDRDGEIARVEWVGDPLTFARLDRNDNGVVGRWEYGVGWLLDA